MTDELSASAAESYIHYQPIRVDYSISDIELGQLCQCSSNHWKDFCLTCAGVGIPCFLNTISLAMKANAQFASADFVLNCIFGLVGLVLALAFAIAWHKTHKGGETIISQIKNKPRMRLPKTS